MKEAFFTPWSLARVAKAVEWEDELMSAKDGSTNQGKYMEALAILYERWMREWALPDFEQAVLDIHNKEFFSLFARIITSMEERVFQLSGFFRGLWMGANPTWRSTTWPPMPAPPEPLSELEVATNRLQAFFTYLLDVSSQIKEETYGGFSSR